MSPFQLAAILVALAAASSYINFQFIHLPSKIGAIAIALIISLIIVGVGALGAALLRQEAQALVKGIHFSGLLLDGALAFCCSRRRWRSTSPTSRRSAPRSC